MAEAKHPGPGEVPGHELSDLQPRTIAVFGIALAVTVIACLILGVWLFDFFAVREARQDVPPSPLAKREIPSGPLLQVSAPKELEEIRKVEEKILNGYDWVDRQAGIVRIPIGRAMELLAERGLPPGSETPPGRRPGQPAKARRK